MERVGDNIVKSYVLDDVACLSIQGTIDHASRHERLLITCGKLHNFVVKHGAVFVGAGQLRDLLLRNGVRKVGERL